jgi:hypothetical protein
MMPRIFRSAKGSAIQRLIVDDSAKARADGVVVAKRERWCE